MKTFHILLSLILISSFTQAFVPPNIFIKSINPKVPCLHIQRAGEGVFNNCSYDFQLIRDGKKVGVVPKKTSILNMQIGMDQCSSNNCYLEGEGQKIKLTLVVYKGTEEIRDIFFYFWILLLIISSISKIILIYDKHKKRKEKRFIKNLFRLSLLLVIILFTSLFLLSIMA